MKRILTVMALVLFFAVPSLSMTMAMAQGPGHDERGIDDVARITAAELRARIEGGADIVLLDVRSRGAYNASSVKIKGAVRIAPDEIPTRLWELPFGREIATYCT